MSRSPSRDSGPSWIPRWPACGPLWAVTGSINVRFRKPVRVDDELTARAGVETVSGRKVDVRAKRYFWTYTEANGEEADLRLLGAHAAVDRTAVGE